MQNLRLEEEKALIRLFHSMIKIPAVDVYINGDLIFNNVEFVDFTKYENLYEGNLKVDVYVSGKKDNPIISQMVNVISEHIYTIAMVGQLDSLNLLIIPDKVDKETLLNSSALRFVNLSNELTGIDIYINKDKFLNEIGFKQGCDYIDLLSETYHLKIVDTIKQITLLPLKVRLNPNKIYTIYLIQNEESLNAIQSVDGNTYIFR